MEKNKHYIPVERIKKPIKQGMTREEKIQRLYKLAAKINVTIGDGYEQGKRY